MKGVFGVIQDNPIFTPQPSMYGCNLCSFRAGHGVKNTKSTTQPAVPSPVGRSVKRAAAANSPPPISSPRRCLNRMAGNPAPPPRMGTARRLDCSRWCCIRMGRAAGACGLRGAHLWSGRGSTSLEPWMWHTTMDLALDPRSEKYGSTTTRVRPHQAIHGSLAGMYPMHPQ